MTKESWSTFGGRLRWAIYQQPAQGRRSGIRLFQARLEEAAPELQGTSLTSIQTYLRDEVGPSAEFVERAAMLLGVRPAWLAWSSGAPTEEDEAARLEKPAEAQVEATQIVREHLGCAGTRSEPAPWAPAVLRAAHALRARQGIQRALDGRPYEGDLQRSIDKIAGAVAAPLRSVEIEGWMLDDNGIAGYTHLVTAALDAAIRSADWTLAEDDDSPMPLEVSDA